MSDSRSPLIEYISERYAQEDYLLNNILVRQEEDGGPPMNIGPDQGKFLSLIIKLMKPKRILEVGSYYGYSSVWMGRAVKDLNDVGLESKLICAEVSPKNAAMVREHLQGANLESCCELKEASGISLMQSYIDAGEKFDLIFVDADKVNYSNYLDLAAKLLPKGALLLVDNTIWSERVLDANSSDKATKAIQAFNDKLSESKDFDSVIVTIQDGLAFAVRK